MRGRSGDSGGRSGESGQIPFADVYDAHIWDVYGFFGYRLSSREEAEDLTQATFERALRAWSRYDPERASPRTWLLAIASNLLIDHFRRGRGDLPPELIAEAELRERHGAESASLGVDPDLAAALGCLTDQQRQVIALRFGGDLNGPEIAELTGLSLANVQQVLSRSLRRLRAELEPAADAPEPGAAGTPES
jgi:RNA polymerase sigma-70 factor (ECF subfamily)